MNRPSSSIQSGESSPHERAIEVLARQAHVPVNYVTMLYERELAVLTVGARITGFLPILTTRKVREILRQRSRAAHAAATPAPQEAEAHTHPPTIPDSMVHSLV